jgi:hypothetical protein
VRPCHFSAINLSALPQSAARPPAPNNSASRSAWSANIAAGFGDGISFGATDYVRNLLGINDGIDHDSGAYVWSHRGGIAYSTVLGFGAAGNTARGGAWAVYALRGYAVAGDVDGVARSSLHLAQGDSTRAHRRVRPTCRIHS